MSKWSDFCDYVNLLNEGSEIEYSSVGGLAKIGIETFSKYVCRLKTGGFLEKIKGKRGAYRKLKNIPVNEKSY